MHSRSRTIGPLGHRAAWALVPAGLLWATFLFLHPAHDPEGFQSPLWVPVHLMPHTAALLAVLGLTAAQARQAERSGGLGTAAYVTVVLGLGMTQMPAFLELVTLPFLGLEAPDLLDRMMEQSPAGMVIGLLNNAVLALGHVLFGAAVLRAGMLSRWGGAMLIVAGAAHLPVNTFGLAPEAVGTAVYVVLGAGYVLLGASVPGDAPAAPTAVRGRAAESSLDAAA